MNNYKLCALVLFGLFINPLVHASNGSAEKNCFTNDRLAFEVQPKLSADGYRMLSNIAVSRKHDDGRISQFASDTVELSLVSEDSDLYIENNPAFSMVAGIATFPEGSVRVSKMALGVRVKATVNDPNCVIAPVYSEAFDVDR